MQSLSRLNKSYKNFFDSDGPKEQENSGNDVKKGGFNESWGWFSIVDSLSNSRIDKWEQIMDWEVIYALNVCSYYKDKQRMEKQLQMETTQRLKRR